MICQQQIAPTVWPIWHSVIFHGKLHSEPCLKTPADGFVVNANRYHNPHTGQQAKFLPIIFLSIITDHLFDIIKCDKEEVCKAHRTTWIKTIYLFLSAYFCYYC